MFSKEILKTVKAFIFNILVNIIKIKMSGFISYFSIVKHITEIPKAATDQFRF